MTYNTVKTNDKSFPVRFGFNALSDFCELTGLSIQDIQNLGENVSPSAVRSLLYCGLKHGARVAKEDFELKLEDVGDLMDDDAKFTENILKYFEQSQPPAEDGVEKKEQGKK